MKKTIGVFCFLYSFVLSTAAQDCKKAYYFTEGKVITFTKYGKTGEVTGKDIGTVSSVKEEGGVLKAQYRLIKYDAKGKVKEDGIAEIICDGSGLKLGFQVPDMESGKSNSAFFTYPADMKEGQSLEAKLEMQIKGKAKGKNVDMYFKVENRKVAGKEKLKISLGSYDAFKITYDLDIRIKVMGIGIPMKLKIIEWYSPGVGVLKTETYDKDGKLEETSIVTSIK